MTARKKMRYATLVKEKCPLGYTIRLTTQCWYIHIIPSHGDMDGNSEDVRETIKNPDIILENKKEGRYNLVYHKSFKNKYNPNKHVRVPVRIDKKTKEGTVTSAFSVIDVLGGKEIWKK